MFQQASTGLSYLLIVNGGGVNHHLHPLHGGRVAGGQGGQHKVSQRRLHHRADRQLHRHLLHRGVPPPPAHLPTELQNVKFSIQSKNSKQLLPPEKCVNRDKFGA